MDNPNPIHYRDLITPDSSITDLIAQLQELMGQYDQAKAKIQVAAKEMAQGMTNITSATEQQREQIRLSTEESDKLLKQYTDVGNKTREAARAFVELTQAKRDQNQIDKLIVQINNSAEGSYNRLSAQYRLNKIRLNEMSEAERSATEAGRKLERETKAIYEQMNRQQLATGKAQLQVGHYERGLLSAVGVQGQFAEILTDSTKRTEIMQGTMGVLKSKLGLVIGLVGAGVGAFKLFKASVSSTQATSDALAFSMAELSAIWDRFAKSMATLDFRGFIRDAAESARAGRELAMVLDEVFERTNSARLLRSALSAENAMLEETARNAALPYKERLAAANKYIANVRPIYEQEQETAKRVANAQLEYLFTVTNQRQYATDAERERAKQEFADNIKNYNLNESLILQAFTYNKTVDNRKKIFDNVTSSSQAMWESLQKQADAMDRQIAQTPEAVKAFANFARQYNITSDEQVKAYVDAQVAADEATAALQTQNKRFINLTHSIEASITKEAEAQSKARQKAIEDEKKAEGKRQEELKKSAEEAAKYAQEQIALQQQILQAQLTSINTQIAITQEGTDEMLRLRIEALNKQRDIELFQNKNKAEELRTDELLINAKYDQLILRESSKFYTQRANEEFAQQQALDASEFALLQTTEQEKTRFRLQQEKARLQKILELNETNAEKLSETEIATIRNTIAKIDKEYAKAGRGQKDTFDLIGLGGLDDDQKAAMDSAVQATLANVASIIDAWKQAAEARVQAAETSVESAKTELDAEIEARDNGYANNVAQAQRNLDLKKKELADAQKEKEKATKAQLLLDTITQTASLITASANIWASLSVIPIVGPALAIAALATMWGSFAIAKVKAAQVASSGTESYGEGTVELLEGGSHASGHDIDMGRKKDGTRRRAEGGEFFAVINKHNSRRYRSIIPDVINSFNDGSFSQKYQRANGAVSNIAMAMGNGTDISKLERDVHAIRTQGDDGRYTDGQGNTVIRHKNLTRTIKVS